MIEIYSKIDSLARGFIKLTDRPWFDCVEWLESRDDPLNYLYCVSKQVSYPSPHVLLTSAAKQCPLAGSVGELLVITWSTLFSISVWLQIPSAGARRLVFISINIRSVVKNYVTNQHCRWGSLWQGRWWRIPCKRGTSDHSLPRSRQPTQIISSWLCRMILVN